MSNSGYFIKSIGWIIISKLTNSIVQFISVPLLLSYFGKLDFSLVVLIMSINAYLQLLDFGVNTGAIKYFSEWIKHQNFEKVDSVARTSISFYGIIGLFNALILVVIAFWGQRFFSIDPVQQLVMQKMLLIMAFFSVINWITSVFNQLLIANENIYILQQINIFKSLFSFLVIYLTIKLKLSITTYFIWYSIVNAAVIVPLYLMASKRRFITSVIPHNDWIGFKEVFKYSVSILAVGIFQMSAVNLRPVVLSIFTENGIGIVTDYRIMETITLFVISIGGMLISVFLPKTTKLLIENDHEKTTAYINKSTLYSSIFSIILCVPFIICSNEILFLYVGKEYVHLGNWLILWLLTILLFLHNTPVASLVLSTGKTKMLVISSAISCCLSIAINAVLCPLFDSGSAIIGYLIYILIQSSFYYLYFNKKVLNLKSFDIFKRFFYPTILGITLAFGIKWFPITLSNLYLQILIKEALWFLLFTLLLFSFRLVNIKELKQLIAFKI